MKSSGLATHRLKVLKPDSPSSILAAAGAEPDDLSNHPVDVCEEWWPVLAWPGDRRSFTPFRRPLAGGNVRRCHATSRSARPSQLERECLLDHAIMPGSKSVKRAQRVVCKRRVFAARWQMGSPTKAVSGSSIALRSIAIYTDPAGTADQPGFCRRGR